MIQAGGAAPNNAAQKQAVQQLLQTLKNNPGPEQQQQLLQLLKASPQLMAAFIKQRQQNVSRVLIKKNIFDNMNFHNV